MTAAAILVGVAPVIAFLGALVFLDSYKLVRPASVLGVVAAGAAVALAAYAVNAALLDVTAMPHRAFSRYVAPFTEELVKGLVVVALVRAHRVGFLVDAAILGFAAGAGFAVVENLHYLQLYPGAGMGTWIVRGFGTALMHGGATAVFAVMGLAMVERGSRGAAAYLPGFALAAGLHSAFNHFPHAPFAAAAGTAVLLPVVLHVVFERSERALSQWLGKGFDEDARMLEIINSGRLADSPIGRYLTSLKSRFQGPVVADLLCYVRLHTELALRAKGILLMREAGFEPVADADTRERFEEMRYLERSIGPTGLKAIRPMLHMSRKDLWQLHTLGR